MTRLYVRWTAINNDKCIVNTFKFFKEIRRYTIGFVFVHVRIHLKYADYLICVHDAWSSRKLPSGVTSQLVSN